jgi:hypothetical protein
VDVKSPGGAFCIFLGLFFKKSRGSTPSRLIFLIDTNPGSLKVATPTRLLAPRRQGTAHTGQRFLSAPKIPHHVGVRKKEAPVEAVRGYSQSQ